MRPGRLKRYIFILQAILGLVLIIAILLFISTRQLLTVLSSIDLSFFLLALVCYFLNNILMVARLKRLLAHQGKKLRVKFVFWAHMAGMILSDFTPLRSGYLYTAQALRKKGVPLKTGTATITSTYVYDLLFKVTVALLGIAYLYASLLSPEFTFSLILTTLLIAALLAAFFLILYPPMSFRTFIARWGVGQKLLDIGTEGRRIQQFFPMILAVSLLGWLLRGLQWLCIGYSLHLSFNSLLDAFFLSPLLTLFSLIPLTPAGIGLQEAAIIAVFSVIGIQVSMAASFAFLVRGSEILVDSIGVREFFTRSHGDADLEAHYRSIAGDIDDRAYHSDLLVQRYFQQRKTETIRCALDPAGKGILLDIGCGSGVQIAEIQRDAAGMAVGIDINRNALLHARGKQIPGTSFILADVRHLPVRKGCIGRVVSAEIIEHLSSPETMLTEIRRVLVPGGEVVITTPNEHSIWGLYELFWDLFGRGRNYGETHLSFFTQRELCTFFRDFSSCRTKTLFFLSPLFALANRQALLDAGMKIDAFFEKRGFGVSIVLHAVK